LKLLPKQEKAIFRLKDNVTTELLYGGAAGGGKSALGSLWLIECCQKYEGSRWLMGRSKLKTLKETTLVTFFELASKLGVSDQFTFNAQSNTINWHNGSVIILRDLFQYPSDPEFDSLGSLEVTGSFIDEVSQLTNKAWTVAKSRCRFGLLDYCNECGSKIKETVLETESIDGIEIITKWICDEGHTTKGLIPKQLGTCNPTKNWVYKNFYIADDKNTLPKYRSFISALPKDNPHLPKSYIETLENMPEVSRQRLLLGNWEFDDDKAALISYNAITDYWNGQHVEKGENKYLTIDVARKGKDKTVFRIWAGWVCIERHEMGISKINEVVDKAKELQAIHGIQNTRTIADEDGVGGGVVDYLRCEGFVNNSKAKMEEVGDLYIQTNYANLKSQCTILMAKKIEAREVTEVCNDSDIMDIVSEEMQQVKLKDIDKDGKLMVIPKDKIKENIARSPDDWDSIMMRYYFELEQEFFIV